MPLPWPGASMGYGNLEDGEQAAARSGLDTFADLVQSKLLDEGLGVFASPLWRPWNICIFKGEERFGVVFAAPGGGITDVRWQQLPAKPRDARDLERFAANYFGWTTLIAFMWDEGKEQAMLEQAAEEHVAALLHRRRFAELGDLAGLEQLVRPLEVFLKDHPNFDRNVFIMMRFAKHAQLEQVYQAVKTTLAARGFDAVRADERDYTGELWSNIQTYMHGCKYGIAVFEDFTGARELNPNVSLELGYMVARQKRTLILREKTLPVIPADLMHRLYRPFDVFNITPSIEQEVGRWVDVDLRPAT